MTTLTKLHPFTTAECFNIWAGITFPKLEKYNLDQKAIQEGKEVLFDQCNEDYFAVDLDFLKTLNFEVLVALKDFAKSLPYQKGLIIFADRLRDEIGEAQDLLDAGGEEVFCYSPATEAHPNPAMDDTKWQDLTSEKSQELTDKVAIYTDWADVLAY